MKKEKIKVLLLTIFLSISVLGFSNKPKREMRAVWIATVDNIDWPSSKYLSSKKQKEEMVVMLDKLKKAKVNTIFIQVRPSADSFYPSQLEPWSEYLTGVQGKNPTPYYDPFQFIIEEAHRRCIEVHAWINPYRVTNETNQIKRLAKNHLYNKNRKIFVKYGGKYYFNPGYDETREFLNKVVEDIVMNYDVDGIHFDDYFYPYPIHNKEFPDQQTFLKNSRGFNHNEKDNWRRNNVNLIINQLQKTIKSLKPWVQFGVSPFGVWRNKSKDPKGSETEAGITNYDDLYADVLKWLKDGSIDYVVPQLYWAIGKKIADYSVLVKWWSENSYNQNLYIGLYASGLKRNKAKGWKSGNQLAKQLNLNQKYSNVQGSVFFSARSFLQNPKGLLDTLQNNYYQNLAIHPICNNIGGEKSIQPQNIKILKDRKEHYLVWDKIEDTGGCQIAYYVVYGFKGKKVGNLNDSKNIIALTTDNYLNLNKLEKEIKGRNTFVVTAINRYKQESIPTYGVSRRL